MTNFHNSIIIFDSVSFLTVRIDQEIVDLLGPKLVPSSAGNKTHSRGTTSDNYDVLAGPSTTAVKTASQNNKLSCLPRPKNVNKEVCGVDPRYQKSCVVCKKTQRHIVSHYVNDHPDCEVYISRLSQRMADQCLQGVPKLILTSNGDYEGLCVFCEKQLSYRRDTWFKHMVTHTGEYGFECGQCHHKSAQPNRCTCKSKSSKKMTEIQLLHSVPVTGNYLYAYLCTLCNYIQMTSHKLTRHVKEEHGLNQTNVSNYVNRIKIINLRQNRNEATEATAVTRRNTAVESSTIAHSEIDHAKQPKILLATCELKDSQLIKMEIPCQVKDDAVIDDQKPEIGAVAKAILLKPWTLTISSKSNGIAFDMLRDSSLYSLYKCMSKNCSFATADATEMEVHLNKHDANIGDGEMGSHYEHGDHLECAYCALIAGTVTDLILHIIEIHRSSSFQCQHCFYRSVDAHSVVTHLRMYHADDEPVILFCKGYQHKTENRLVKGLKSTLKDIILEPIHSQGKCKVQRARTF